MVKIQEKPKIQNKKSKNPGIQSVHPSVSQGIELTLFHDNFHKFYCWIFELQNKIWFEYLEMMIRWYKAWQRLVVTLNDNINVQMLMLMLMTVLVTMSPGLSQANSAPHHWLHHVSALFREGSAPAPLVWSGRNAQLKKNKTWLWYTGSSLLVTCRVILFYYAPCNSHAFIRSWSGIYVIIYLKNCFWFHNSCKNDT